MFDFIIAGGAVYDGEGGAPINTDIGIRNSRIAEMGVLDDADTVERIDATGKIVTPGFIDAHSHLDGNVTWESRLAPNSGHGITTTIMGNCGVGFAPCRPDFREFTIALMEGVEDIPAAVLNAGLPWSWTSYPDYRDVVGARHFDMNVTGYLPHSCLRTFVMGERAVAGEPATAADIATMQELTAEAVAAGAVGVASTKISAQKTLSGIHAPSFLAEEAEYLGIARGLMQGGGGILQIAPEFNRFPDVYDQLAMLTRVARDTGCRMTFSLKQSNQKKDGWRDLLHMAAEARADGVELRPQVLGRPTGAILTWECSFHPFVRCPSYAAIAHQPMVARAEILAEPATRNAILSEYEFAQSTKPGRFPSLTHLIFPMGEVPDYEPKATQSIAHLANSNGTTAAALTYDCLMEDEGRGALLMASGNYSDCSLEPAREMMAYDGAILGLGDGGAHSTIICDASATTYMISYWSRDRRRGPRLALTDVVRALTANIADFFNLHDRGRLAPGKIADINVIDRDAINLGRPRMSYDLPAGGKRLVQPATGYMATFVSGIPTVRNDRPTAALPGRLI